MSRKHSALKRRTAMKASGSPQFDARKPASQRVAPLRRTQLASRAIAPTLFEMLQNICCFTPLRLPSTPDHTIQPVFFIEAIVQAAIGRCKGSLDVRCR
jgi:hypothetical protein